MELVVIQFDVMVPSDEMLYGAIRNIPTETRLCSFHTLAKRPI